MRKLVFLVFLVNVCIGIIGIILIPGSLWFTFGPWQIVSIALPLVLSFCFILVGWWLYRDEMEIDSLKEEINNLRDEIRNLEKNSASK